MTSEQSLPDEVIPPGDYRARFLGVEEVPGIEEPDAQRSAGMATSSSNDPQFIVTPARKFVMKPKLRWTFCISVGGDRSVKVSAQTSQKFHEDLRKSFRKTKPLQWVETILGRRIPPGAIVDWDELVDRWCKVDLGVKRGRNVINDVLPRDWD